MMFYLAVQCCLGIKTLDGVNLVQIVRPILADLATSAAAIAAISD